MKLDESLQHIKDEVEIIDGKVGWQQLYNTIRNESIKHDFSLFEAKLPANKLLNRYRDVSPFDHSRVILKSGPYINASLVKVEKAGRNYILTQGPLPQTVSHFWLMVWEQRSRAVLMLNKIIEKNQVKCHQYWPMGSHNGGSDFIEFPEVGLKIHLIKEDKFHHFIKRTLKIEELSRGEEMEIIQFHYMTWPDFGTPSTPNALLHFLQVVRDSSALNSDLYGPAIVHCSAGIGRSGTFCLIDSCLQMMEQGIEINAKDILMDMRKYRMGLIQTADQLKFSYLAILEGIKLLAEGKREFPEDTNGVGLIEDDKPPQIPSRVESRDTSLEGHNVEEEYERFLRMMGIGNPESFSEKPLPSIPLDTVSSSSDDSIPDDDDDDSDSDSDLLQSDEKEAHPLINQLQPDETIPINNIQQHGETQETNSLQHKKSNGVEDDVLRRRMKKEATMEKLKEIKQKQKELEKRQELFRLFTDKKVLLCCFFGISALAAYFYSSKY